MQHRTGTPEWHAWYNAIRRCTNPSDLSYPNYGGRGITVCDEWRGPDGFVSFILHIGPRSPLRMLDRIDNDGDYEPGNVRWATRRVSSLNKRGFLTR